MLAKWLVDDVLKTANASALAMLTAFTRRIMASNSKENPEDVLKRILDKVSSVWEVTNAEGGSSTRKQPKRGRAKKQPRNHLPNRGKVRVEKVAEMTEAFKEL